MRAAAKPLDCQVIVLTGAGSIVGLCTAQLAANRGAKLVLLARHPMVVHDLAARLAASGVEVLCLGADMADRAQAHAAARAAADRFGHIDTWINNACASIYGRLEDVPEAEARRLFDINFWGVVNASLAALPHLLADGGALVNVGSEVPEEDVPFQGLYASSKLAVKGFTQALRAELEEPGRPSISVTFVEPDGLEPRRGGVMRPHEVAQAILDAACAGPAPAFIA